MDSSEIISELKKRGFNKNAAVTQETLYSEINRDQLFSNTNRLNAGWGRGKVIIAKYQSSSHSESEYIREWLNLANKYQDQFLCLETAPGEWNFYDYNGKLMSYQELFPTSNSCQENITSSYRPYITAIKSKPFLLLAGISGTGKSRIVRELARACWDVNSAEYKAHKPKNFEMVQVKPNWHDSSELIGYVSRIDGVRYVVGPFLKFMVKAIQDPNTPYFLCLDEMNLAPVEQYFAEFLSVVESRKVDKDGNVVTDPLVDYSSTEEYKSLIDQLFCDDAERKAYLTEVGGKRLTIPQNLIVVGTVNMDETTFSFSRKVLDRAMTIEMNKVDLMAGLTNRHENIGKIEFADIIGKAVEGVDVYAAHQTVCDKAIAYLKSINATLDKTPFKVAYRTRNELLLYVVNNLSWKTDDELEDFVIARALDEITCMKILTRIEGDETKVSANFLDNLGNAIKSGLVEIDKDLLQANKSHKGDAYQPISLDKLNEMKERLKSGYTSFWS
jgi:5-methylcytosine-specific restriction protein B